MQVSVNIGNKAPEPPRPERILPPTVKERPEHWVKPEPVASEATADEPQAAAEPAPAVEEHLGE